MKIKDMNAAQLYEAFTTAQPGRPEFMATYDELMARLQWYDTGMAEPQVTLNEQTQPV